MGPPTLARKTAPAIAQSTVSSKQLFEIANDFGEDPALASAFDDASPAAPVTEAIGGGRT
jgi:hypothetical protein